MTPLHTFRLFGLGSVLFAMLVGCTTTPTVPPPQAPFFRADAQELKAFQALGKKQESIAAKCASGGGCDQAHFIRGLIALFESRELAINYFQKVVTHSQKSRYGPASQQWLQLLQSPTVGASPSWFSLQANAAEIAQEKGNYARTLEQLVRDLLSREGEFQTLVTAKDAEASTIESLQRELAERQKKIDELTAKKDPARISPDSASVHALQTQIEQRDRKIEELSHQLEALKRIDQEMREKARPLRPATVPPPTLGDGETKP